MKVSMKFPFISRINKKSFQSLFQKDSVLKKGSLFFQSRIFLSLLFFLFLFPSFLLFFHYFERSKAVAQCEEELVDIERLLVKVARSEKGRREFFSRYKNVDKEYINSTLASQLFLKKEGEKLRLLLSHPDFQSSLEIKKRLAFFQGKENQLHFIEKERLALEGIEISLLEQANAIEIEMEDLKRLLTLIEAVTIPPYIPPKEAPELFITSFHLQKKEISGTKALLLRLSLLQKVPEKMDAAVRK